MNQFVRTATFEAIQATCLTDLSEKLPAITATLISVDSSLAQQESNKQVTKSLTRESVQNAVLKLETCLITFKTFDLSIVQI